MTDVELRRVPKPWGHELIWALTDRYCGKVLVIEAGKRLSLQKHVAKDESIYVLSGRLLLYLEDDGGDVRQVELGPGEARHVPTGPSQDGVLRGRLREKSYRSWFKPPMGLDGAPRQTRR